jgi:hypothetical protein
MRTLFSGLLASLLLGTGLASAADEPKSDPAAEKLVKEAHDARVDWGSAFPGFTCKLVATVDGKQQNGRLTVGADHHVTVELPDGPVKDLATPQLESLIDHRFATGSGPANVVFADDVKEHPLGRLVQWTGGNTRYRILGDVITEVHRSTGKGKFVISVTEVTRNAEGRYLPRSFNVSYWDGEGNLRMNEDYLEEYVRVGNLDLPRRRLLIRTAKGERMVAEIRFSDHEVLPAKPSK